MSSHWVTDSNAALLTDLYELTMLQSYFHEGMNDTAVFDLFVRRLPAKRNYLVACGLEHVLHYLETLSFSSEAVTYLKSLRRFSDEFLESLRDFRFTGDIFAVPEGTVVFANEPMIEVVAPLPQAQLVETFVMNQIQVATLAASKAARVVSAARGRTVLDFGVRRMHGADAGIKEPRAFYIAGVLGTSNVLAGQLYGIPVVGTMAHSYVEAFKRELAAFRQFVRQFPDSVLLVDTYDTLAGVRHVIDLATELGSAFRVTGIRLDSGDLRQLAFDARRLLDSAGLRDVKIFASNSLDEYSIEDLLKSGAPLDGFGVGGRLGVSEDAPLLDTAYKLVEYGGRPTMKLSQEKASLPGKKQIFRQVENGIFQRDIVALADEELSGERQLVKVMDQGKRTAAAEPIDALRARCQSQVEHLPASLLSLFRAESPYAVDLGPGLCELRAHTLDLIKEDIS
jgi:nicotinate phosphoribosyltransferase